MCIRDRGYVVLHICQEDIAVDVGDNHIKRTFAFHRGGIALGYGNIVHSIQFYMFEGVAHTPFIYVDSCTRGGSTHACQYGKDGSATTHSEQCFALQVTIQQFEMCIRDSFLAAQYESWTVPIAVLLSLPVAALGAYLGVVICGLENDIYFLGPQTAATSLSARMETYCHGRVLVG